MLTSSWYLCTCLLPLNFEFCDIKEYASRIACSTAYILDVDFKWIHHCANIQTLKENFAQQDKFKEVTRMKYMEDKWLKQNKNIFYICLYLYRKLLEFIKNLRVGVCGEGCRGSELRARLTLCYNLFCHQKCFCHTKVFNNDYKC